MADVNQRQAWVERVLGVRVPLVAEKERAGETTFQVWQSARAAVLADLKGLAQAIVAAEDVEAREAVILLQAVMKNLTARPETLQTVAELERYLADDEIIETVEQPNPFGGDIRLRARLLSPLAGLRLHFEVQEGSGERA